MTPNRTGEGFGTLVSEPIVVDVGLLLVAVPGPTTVVATTTVLAAGCVCLVAGTPVLLPVPPPQLVSVTMVVEDRKVMRVDTLVAVTVVVRPPSPTVVVTVEGRPGPML